MKTELNMEDVSMCTCCGVPEIDPCRFCFYGTCLKCYDEDEFDPYCMCENTEGR